MLVGRMNTTELSDRRISEFLKDIVFVRGLRLRDCVPEEKK